MPKEQAMRNFIDGVMKQMPELKPYLEAHKTAAASIIQTEEKKKQQLSENFAASTNG